MPSGKDTPEISFGKYNKILSSDNKGVLGRECDWGMEKDEAWRRSKEQITEEPGISS